MKNHLSSPLNRRQFLGRSALGAAGVALAAGLPAGAFADDAKKIPVGLELYSVRNECKKDLPGTLAAVSKIGYQGVEFAGYHGRGAQELKKMLNDNGLVVCGSHTPFADVQADKLAATIEFNRVIGNKFIIVPWMDQTDSKQVWMDRVKLFNDLADKLKPEGMFIGYHAHQHDFKKIDGVTAWDLFFGNTKPEVIMQLDTSNCREGGADPVVVLKKYPGRARSIHIKAHGAGPEGVVGEGDVDWKEVFAFCEGPGKTEWYVVEHETSKDPMDAAKRSYQALQKLGKA
jgi:sugar phosphate isomerase/epimerase